MYKNFDLLDLKNPFRFYKRARKETPVFYDEESGYWIVTRYKDIKDIISDENGYSAELERVNYSNFSNEVKSILCPIHFDKLYGLSTTENPTHDKVKAVLMPAFNDLFKNNLKPQIESKITHAIERLKNEQCVDMVGDFFHPLPAEIIFLILGLNKEDVAHVKEWSESRMQLTWGGKERQAQHALNIVKYWDFCGRLLQEKMSNPAEDLPSKLLKANEEGKITMHEIQLLCYGLIFSGHATTSAFLAESLKVLLEKGHWDEFPVDVSKQGNAASELLRYCPSAFTRRRKALKDFCLRGELIKKGAQLLLVIGSGNRDEDVFQQPDILDLTRKNAHKHLSLGRGFHYCIGARLVKLECTLVMSLLKLHFPDLKLSKKNTYEYSRNISIRSLKSLHVELN